MKNKEELINALHVIRNYLINEMVDEPKDYIDDLWNVKLCNLYNDLKPIMEHVSSNQTQESFRKFREIIT